MLADQGALEGGPGADRASDRAQRAPQRQARPARRRRRATRSSEARSRARCSTAARSSSCRPRRAPASPRSSRRSRERDLVRPAAASFAGEVAFRFKHLLVREAAYRATAKRLRATLHERFADWLERVAGDRSASSRRSSATTSSRPTAFAASSARSSEEARARRARRRATSSPPAAARGALGDFEAVASMIRRALALGVARSATNEAACRSSSGRRCTRPRHVAEAEEVLTETHDAPAARRRRHRRARARPARLEQDRRPERRLDDADRRSPSRRSRSLTRAGDQRGLALARRLRGHRSVRTGGRPTLGAELEQALRTRGPRGDKEMLRLRSARSPTRTSRTGRRRRRGDRALRGADRVGAGDRVLEATVKRPLARSTRWRGRREASAALGEASDRCSTSSTPTAQVYRRVGADAPRAGGRSRRRRARAEGDVEYFRDLRGGELDTRAMQRPTGSRISTATRALGRGGRCLAYDPGTRRR